MATPRNVARSLRQTAAKVARIGDETVQGAATFAVETGASVGGRFGRSQLTVVIRSQSNRRGAVSATVAGKTAAAWSIKSYGRTGGYLVRPRSRRGRRAVDLRSAGTRRTAAAFTRPGSTRGDDRWNERVAAPTRDQFDELFTGLLDDAVTG